jgi:hypothetical protein
MEQNIKNFDRAIERKMNEEEVAPPFSAWNRISAELDAMPSAATPAPTSALPRRAIAGMIAAALMLGVTVATAYFVNSSLNDKSNGNIAAPAPAVATQIATSVNTASLPVAEPVVAPVNHTKKPHHVSPKVPAQVAVTAEKPAETIQPKNLLVNNSADVPTPVMALNTGNLTEASQPYYFPPVDRNNPERNSEKANGANSKPDDAKVNDDDDNAKVKAVKFKPKKRHGFSYGKINRMR